MNSKQALFAHMLDGSTIITPNNRLSNQLIADFYQSYDTIVQKKPICLPYLTFLRSLFDTIRHQYPDIQHPVLLNASQLRYLWQAIISDNDACLCNEGLLQAIEEASSHCQQWEINPLHPSFSQTPQTRQFQHWQQQLFEQLTQKNALIETQLVDYIKPFLSDLTIPSTLIWVYFDEYTPQQHTLQQLFSSLGSVQYHHDLKPQVTTAQYYAASDTHDERMQMMHWLKARLAAGDTRIAVVMAELDTQLSSLERFFKRHLSIDQFSFSHNKPLYDIALISHAFTWLSLDKKTITNQDARLLLQSPFLKEAETERMARSHLLQSAVCLQEAKIIFEQWIHTITPTAPALAKLLTRMDDYPTYDSPKGWGYHFKHRLQSVGFPGQLELDSMAYHACQQLMSVFDELLSLSFIKPIMTCEQALAAVDRLLRNGCLPNRQSTAPIQITNLADASGFEFDSLWVAGLTDLCLPKKTRFSAFIPLTLQQKHQLPHTSAAHELHLAQQVLQRLQHASRQCVVSYPKLTQDTPNMACALISTLPRWQPFPISVSTNNIATQLIAVEESYSLPLRPLETALGGASLLANQAKCPFRAFAAHRLHLAPDVSISTGLNASERGQVLHHIMEQLWREIGSLQQLNHLTHSHLLQQIQTAIDHALIPFIANRPLSFSPLVQSVERSCLTRLVNACFDWEKQRPDFVVTAVEQTFSIELAGLTLRVRVDRIDTLASGEQWVIDYKTSLPSNKPWYEERPEAPQLLLYALLDETIHALLFLQLKAGRLTCMGLSEQASDIAGLNALKKHEHWSDYQQKWRQQLTSLAAEFQAGFCPPIPTRAGTCSTCDFQQLCRIG